MTIMTLLMVVIIGFTGFITIALLRGTLVSQAETDIKSNTLRMAQALQPINSSIDTPKQIQFGDNYYAALIAPDGSVINVIPTYTDDEPVLPPGLDTQFVDKAKGLPFTLPGKEKGSAGWRTIITPLQGGNSVLVSYSLQNVNRAVDQAAIFISITGVIAIFVASGIAYLAVSRAFVPLRRVERTAAAIAAGDLSRRVEVSNPATEIGRLSRSLNAMLAHIENAFAARSESEAKMRRFVADASHELRTPLVTIRGFSELYRHGGLPQEENVAEAMGRIESEAKRMGQLVEDLLMLARIDEQRPLEAKPVDLLLLGNDAALDAKASAPDREVTVVGLDGPKPVSATTVGDEARLRQVVANLLTNALRYTPEGSPIEIAVGVQQVLHGHSDAVLEIRDHGPGISEADAARVFERFYRADTSRTRETGGTGLGLAIVAALVAQHDGSVRLTDTPGGGATLSIRLPHVKDDGDASPEGELA